ncbi:MAG: divalent-cation tolerance protein CutA [Candidatus Omnitrophica bacterium]|nr:divalent-cation tolerance protein CutA [Candidatus Omnitrophota bacterium]
MKSATKFAILLVTVPDAKTGRSLAKAALRARLIACANLVPRIESFYWWQNRIEAGTEAILFLKTSRAKVKSLENFILDQHPYDTPEVLALPITSGTQRYLDWLNQSVS